jgi:hypothetical protein
MATYKVLQDIEAEDKLLGPLSLKQFIFAIVSAGFIFLAFITAGKTHQLLAVIPYLPFIAVFGVLAAPIGGYQTTDVWLAARVRFFIKPRIRVWFQSEIKDLVNITAPKHEEKIYTDGLNEEEVRSRLKALADTLDSRGWALKSVDINEPTAPDYIRLSEDRLISSSNLPSVTKDIDIHAADDILNEKDNRVASNFNAMVLAASEQRKQAIINKMNEARTTTSTIDTTKKIDELEVDNYIAERKKESDIISKNLSQAHHKTITPLNQTKDTNVQIKAEAVTPPVNADIVDKVKITQKNADSSTLNQDGNDGEVTISLR